MALDNEVLESDEFKAAVKAAVSTELAGLTQNRDDLKAEKLKLKERLDAFGDLNPDDAKKLAADKKKAEEEALKKSGDYDALKSQLEKEHATQIEQLAKERDGYKTSLEGVLIEKAAVEGITEAKGFPKVLKPHVVSKMKLMQSEDGTHRAVILDDNGQPRLKKGAANTGDYMPVSEFVASLKDDEEFSHAFQGSGMSGGAAKTRVEHGGDPNARQKKAAQGVTFV